MRKCKYNSIISSCDKRFTRLLEDHKLLFESDCRTQLTVKIIHTSMNNDTVCYHLSLCTAGKWASNVSSKKKNVLKSALFSNAHYYLV